MNAVSWPNTENYFVFYELEPTFEIDTNLLKEKYLSYIRQFHPDKFTFSAEDLQKSINITSFNNNAYKTLANITNRAQYLLELNGNLLNDNQALPSEFLMEMLELNMQIDEAEDDLTIKQTLTDTINTQKEDIIFSLSENAKNKNWDEVKMCLLKVRYLERLVTRLTNIS